VATAYRFIWHQTGFPSGCLTSSNEGTWVLVHHDSSAALQTVQSASPVCGTKNFVSVRLYSAPQLHRTIIAILVAILGICTANRIPRDGKETGRTGR
jgi:hypothetical protein